MKRAVSSVIAEALLLAIVLVAGLAAYILVFNRAMNIERGASVCISRASVQSVGNGIALLTVSITDTGSDPELVGVYVSNLASSPVTAGGWELDYTAVNLKSGEYAITPVCSCTGFNASSVKAIVFVNGPSTNYRWTQVSGTFYLESGSYQIAVFTDSSLVSNLPSSTIWLRAVLSVPKGSSFVPSALNPLSLNGTVVVNAGASQGSDLNFSMTENQAGIPAGYLKGGQSVTASWLVSGNYTAGESVTVIAEAWSGSGSESACSESATVT